ncbi:MAG: iron-sulfur cluster assembly scaffold protein [Pseudomonadota bacterium]
MGLMVDLYHNRVLELAADIPHVGTLPDAHGSATKVSRICGSTVRVDVKLSKDGNTVEAIAVDPKACALGQAATAILAENAIGATYDELIEARDQLRAMLKDGAEPPRGKFWELRHLEGVRDYPPRHASTMLAFEAILEAIETTRTNRAAVADALPAA